MNFKEAISTEPGLIEQVSNSSTYSKLTIESLTKVIGEAFSKPVGHAIQMYTGRRGAKDFVKAWCAEMGWEYNLRNFRKAYTFLRKSGHLRVCIYNKVV